MQLIRKSNLDIFIILFMLYGTLIFSFFDFAKENFLTVKLVTIIVSYLYLQLSNKLTFGYKQRKVLIYFLGFSILLLFNFFLMNLNNRIFLNTISTYFVCTIIVFYFLSFNDEKVITIIKKIIIVIVYIFLFQFVGSIYESYVGRYLAFGDIIELKEAYVNWQNRLLIDKPLGFLNLISLNFPLSGFLGQHNNWGAQLPFYNLLVLKILSDTHRKKYLIISALILLAAFLNTSRFAIAAILITDIIFISKIYKRNIFLNGLIIILLLSLILILPEIYSAIVDNFYRANTFTYRVDNYSAIANFYSRMTVQNIIVGYGLDNLEKTYILIMGFAGNFESEILMDFIAYGVLGLTVLFLFWYKLYAQFAQFTSNKIFGFLLLLNILLVSITVNGISYYFVAPFVTLFYIYILSSENIHNKANF